MTKIFFIIVLLSTGQLSAQESDFYHFKINSLEGKEINFSDFKGKKVLIVNTASKCGFTPQYAELQELHEKYGEKLVLIGFPSNDFMKQEPGNSQEIREFCTKNYGVSFLLTEKIHVKGKNQHEIYKWLTHKKQNGFSDSKVTWNFQKYLLDENGKLVAVFAPSVKPLSPEITRFLE